MSYVENYLSQYKTHHMKTELEKQRKAREVQIRNAQEDGIRGHKKWLEYCKVYHGCGCIIKKGSYHMSACDDCYD